MIFQPEIPMLDFVTEKVEEASLSMGYLLGKNTAGPAPGESRFYIKVWQLPRIFTIPTCDSGLLILGLYAK